MSNLVISAAWTLPVGPRLHDTLCLACRAPPSSSSSAVMLLQMQGHNTLQQYTHFKLMLQVEEMQHLTLNFTTFCKMYNFSPEN